MSDLLATLREAKVASEGMIRDRAFPQKDLQQIEQNFSEADREIIWQVGKGERVEAILRSNNALHLVQHAPTPTEPIRFEIRSIPEPANAMRWIVVTLIGLAVFVWAWHQHDRRSAVIESDRRQVQIEAQQKQIGTLNNMINKLNEQQKGELVKRRVSTTLRHMIPEFTEV